MTLTGRLLLLLLIEVLFFVLTRVILHYLHWSSIEAELLRTGLRLTSVLVYLYLFRSLILAPPWHTQSLRSPLLLLGVGAFMSVPPLFGAYSLPDGMALLFAVTSLPVALKEELLFRGILQQLLGRRLAPWAAILLTSILFTAWHLGALKFSPWTFLQIGLASVILGLVYARTGSLLAVIVLHAVYDALFAYTPVLPMIMPHQWIGVPLLLSVVLLLCWAGKTVLTGLPGRNT